MARVFLSTQKQESGSDTSSESSEESPSETYSSSEAKRWKVACCVGSDSERERERKLSDSDGIERSHWVCGVIPIRSYNTIIRLRTAYALGTVSVTMVSVTLGAALQIFFSVFQGHALEATGWTGFKVMLFTPVLFLAVAAIADEMWDMLLDSLDDPPLRNFRSYLMAVGMRPQAVDPLIIGVSEVLPIVTMVVLFSLKGDIQLHEDLAFYMVGTQIAATLLALTYFATHVATIMTGRTLKMEKLALGIDRRRCLIGQTGDVLTNRLHWRHRERADVLQEHALSRAYTIDDEEKGRQQAEAWKRLVIGLIVVMIATVVLYLLSFSSGSFLKALLSMTVLLMVIARIIKHILPGLLGVAFDSMIGAFIVIALGLIVFSSSNILDLDARAGVVPNLFEPPPAGLGYDLPAGRIRDKYPICSMRWGPENLHDPYRLSVLDLAVFADAVYMNYDDEVESVLRNATDGTHLQDVETLYLEDRHTVGRWGIFRLNSSKTLVLAIRGTTSRQDAIGDADMYASIKVMQLFNQFMPVISLYPAAVTRGIIGYFAAHKHLGERPLWYNVTKTAYLLSKRNPDYDLIVTGHSLGGALAIIAGSWVGAQSVAFSPPGQRYSSFRFGISIQGIEKSVTIIKPRKDIVPEVDQQVGFTQWIECNASAIKCHALTRTSCELFRNCGDVRGRTMNENCALYG